MKHLHLRNMHKVLFISILTFQILILGCSKESASEFGYPRGIFVGEMESENDCSLPACSQDRIIRLVANDVNGKVFRDITSDQYGVSYTYSFDSFIIFYFCDLPEEFQEEDLEVKFSGKLLDACGIINASWPTEEVYLLDLYEISRK